MTNDRKRKRYTMAVRLFTLLPPELQARFQGLLGEDVEESQIHELTQALKEAALSGAISRRAFLQAANLLFAAGFASALIPRRAEAWQAWTGFWQNVQSNSYSTTSDPYWDYVILSMGFDGSNGSTVFADESNSGRTPTVYGSAYIDSSLSPFSGGKGSMKCAPATTDGVSFASTSQFDLAGDFTIEAWIYSTDNGTGGDGGARQIVSTAQSGVTSSWSFSISFQTLNKISFFDYRVSGSMVTGSTSIPLNTWTHVAVSRQGTTLRLFVNGALDGSSTSSYNYPCTTPLWIGRRDTSNVFSGNLSDIRLYNGIAKYTAAFTAPTAPVGLGSANDSNWGYCVLACPFENTLKDMSGKKITSQNSAAISTTDKKFGSASAYFNGTNQSIYAAASSDFNIGTGDFTIEFWVNADATQAQLNPRLFSLGAWNASSGFNFYIGCSAGAAPTATPGFQYWNGSATTDWYLTALPSAGVWHHCALSRRNGTMYWFINGVLKNTTTLTVSLGGSSLQFNVGSDGVDASNYHFKGYIDSFRVSKGVARYTADFTPPTAGLPIGKDETTDPFWTNTVLALHLDDLTDSTGRHTLSNGNSVTNNTTTKKYGTASASFNGSNQYLSTATQSDFDFGTGDFTIDYYAYSNTTGLMGHFKNEAAAGSYTSSSLSLGSSSSSLSIRVGSGTTYANLITTNPSVAVPINTWNHWAVVRSGSTLSIYLNGISIYSSTALGSNSISNAGLLIGQHAGNSMEYFSGYIDDFRITKGVARYAQNFTPPTRAFATGTVYANRQSFSYTGSLQTFTVPAGVTSIYVKAWGAAGGPSPYSYSAGGGGGFASAKISVTPGEQLQILVGGGGGIGDSSNTGSGGTGGYGGGAAGGNAPNGDGGRSGGGGGGRSQVATSTGTPVLIAGGGGGGGYYSSNQAVGGPGGGSIGGTALPSSGGGAGGSQSTGGSSYTGTAGVMSTSGANYASGGGGGGYYGGLGGTSGGGGGGGSGYYDSSRTSGQTLITGSLYNPANPSDPDRGSAGQGSQSSSSAGTICIYY